MAPRTCCMPGCIRAPYCGVKEVTCGCHVLDHAFRSQNAEAVIRVDSKRVRINGIKQTVGEYKSAPAEAIVDVDSIFSNIVVGKFLVTQDNDDSDWRTVPISEHPTGNALPSNYVWRHYSGKNSGDKDQLPYDMIRASLPEEVTDEEWDDIAKSIADSRGEKKASYTKKRAERAAKASRGEDITSKRWLCGGYSSNGTPICCMDGCDGVPSSMVPGYPCWPCAIKQAANVEIDGTILEVTLALRASFLVDDKEEDELYTVSLERSSKICGYKHNGVYWKADPEEICLILANATSKTVDGSAYRSPLDSEENHLDRKELCLKRMKARAEPKSLKVADLKLPKATPEVLSYARNKLEQIINGNPGFQFINVSKGTASATQRSIANEFKENVGDEGILSSMEQANPALYQRALPSAMNGYEGTRWATRSGDGPTFVTGNGGSLPLDYFYKGAGAAHVKKIQVFWGKENEVLNVELFLQELSIELNKSGASKLVPLWEITGAGKRNGDTVGLFGVEVVLVNFSTLNEVENVVMNDARSLVYKAKISKHLGGYEKAKEMGLFVEQTDPSYKNMLEYKRKRNQIKSNTKQQLRAAWDRAESRGIKVERMYGTLDAMKKSLSRFLTILGPPTPNAKSAVTPQTMTVKKRIHEEI